LNKFPEYISDLGIGLNLNSYKTIILEEETQLELGGIDRYSTSVVFPTNSVQEIEDGRITLIGPEIKNIQENLISFGQIIVLGGKNISETQYTDLQRMQFVSDSIEGFMIRSIPRRFWCRISKEVINKGFSFELLGNAITHLYKTQFPDLIEAVEVLFVSASEENLKKFDIVISKIREIFKKKWEEKVEEWKKRVDCDYDWACDDCPYNETCESISEIDDQREQMGA
jgi:CO dehydrogenase/acetyl-CoA synthase beta subunit